MSKLVTTVLAAGAAVSIATLSGLAPAQAVPHPVPADSAPAESTPAESTPADSAADSAPAGATPAESVPADSAPTSTQTEQAGAGDTSAKDLDPAAAAVGEKVQLLGINDFHGRLVEAGAQVASVVEEQRAAFDAEPQGAGSAFVAAGDLIGASTYVSGSQQDIPTLDALNAMGLDASSVGNHEFDQGLADLVDKANSNAEFPYLAANVYLANSGKVPEGLKEYAMVKVGDIDVAVIGAVTRETSSLVSPAGIKGLEFGDATDAINRVVEDINALPADEQPDMTVVSAHIGASTTESLDAALASNAEFKKLVTESDASIDAIFTGHTHMPYSFDAPVPGQPERTRPVLETGNYGAFVGDVELVSDGDGQWTTVKNELLPTKNKDFDSPVVTKVKDIITDAEEKAKGPGSIVDGTITEDITRAFVLDENGEPVLKDGKTIEDRGAESTLGNLVADALTDGVADSQLAPADFGITNPGGLRADLLCADIYNEEQPCEVTAAELNSVLPFANDHGVVTMKGSDIKGLFEEQWQPDGASRPFLHLGISKQLDVVYDSTAERGKHVVSVKVGGKDIEDDKDYRVATLSFLAAGGDNFASFSKGTFELSGLTDFETWVNYFKKNTPISPDTTERQADLKHDVIANESLTLSLEAPADGIKSGGSADFLLRADAEAVVAGPIDVTVDLPAGYTVDSVKPVPAQAASGQAAAQASGTVTLESIPAGASTYAVRVSAPADATGTVKASVSLQAGDAAWWNNNPMPVAHSFEATANVTAGGGAAASGDEDNARADENAGADDQAAADGGDQDANGSSANGSNGSNGSNAKADSNGQGTDNNGSGDDKGDLPRTGAEMVNTLAAALALIIAGGAAVAVVRRKRMNA